LEIEEERAIWSAKEKTALLAIEEHTKSNNMQITSLSTKLFEVRFTAPLFGKPFLVPFIFFIIFFSFMGFLEAYRTTL